MNLEIVMGYTITCIAMEKGIFFLSLYYTVYCLNKYASDIKQNLMLEIENINSFCQVRK